MFAAAEGDFSTLRDRVDRDEYLSADSCTCVIPNSGVFCYAHLLKSTTRRSSVFFAGRAPKCAHAEGFVLGLPKLLLQILLVISLQ